MSKRMAIIPLTVLTAIALSIAILSGCAETQPVNAEFRATTLNLTPRFLPSAPTGMIYELWVQKEDGTSMSIARFSWDQDLYIMRDESGARIDPMSFDLDFNILEWDFVSVSVEDAAAPSPVAPGSVMLRDTVVSPESQELWLMKFPIDFSQGTFGIASLVTPTDGNFSDDGSGIWFAIYSNSVIRSQDTTDARVNSATTVQLMRDTANDTSTLDTLGIDSAVSITYFRYSRFNLDTIQVNAVRLFYHTVPINTSGVDDTVVFGGPSGDQDTVIYGTNMNYFFDMEYDTLTSSGVLTHQFQNGFTEFPSLAGPGWHYKGWVMGPGTGTGPAEFVRLNFAANKEINWEKPGRLIFSTGIFLDSLVDSSVITGIDTFSFGGDSIQVRVQREYKGEIGYHTVGSDPNPWASSALASIPPFPGEDFSLAGLSGILGVVPDDPIDPFEFTETATDTAIVFVSVEPDNYTDSTKNFPLILMAREIDFITGVPSYKNFRLINQSGVAFPFPNNRKSWPHIVIEPELR